MRFSLGVLVSAARISGRLGHQTTAQFNSDERSLLDRDEPVDHRPTHNGFGPPSVGRGGGGHLVLAVYFVELAVKREVRRR
jgi:hypothetical protein